MATIKDIAKLANVSIATVSMALNNKDCISKKTKDKVLRIANELNYLPSLAAKTLKTNKSKTISLLIGDISNPFFPQIIKGAQACARAKGYSVFLYDLSGGEKILKEDIDQSVRHGVDGIFITGVMQVTSETKNRIIQLCNKGIKMVSSNPLLVHEKIPRIYGEESEPIKGMLHKLIGLGHRHIGCISGYKGYSVSKIRERYYRSVMEEYNLYNPDYITNTGLFIGDGKDAINSLLMKYPEITAVMCINDLLAIGASTAAKEMGRSIPEDLSLFGIDGIEYMEYQTPVIATVAVLRYEFGYKGAERLIQMIESDNPYKEEFMQDIYLTCEMKEGGSIAPPRNNNKDN